jgi:hypothetical protein
MPTRSPRRILKIVAILSPLVAILVFLAIAAIARREGEGVNTTERKLAECIAATNNARTPEEEKEAFLLVNHSSLGYAIVLLDEKGNRIPWKWTSHWEADFHAVRFVDIVWDTGGRLRRRVLDPENIHQLCCE